MLLVILLFNSNPLSIQILIIFHNTDRKIEKKNVLAYVLVKSFVFLHLFAPRFNRLGAYLMGRVRHGTTRGRHASVTRLHLGS